MQQKFEVAVNLAQDFTDEQKKQARDNIGANFIARYIITDNDVYLHDVTKRDLNDSSGYAKVTTSEFNSLKTGDIVLVINDRVAFGGIRFFIGEVYSIGGPVYCVGTQIGDYASDSIINLKLTEADSSDPDAFVTAIQRAGTPIRNFTIGDETYISSTDHIYNNFVSRRDNAANITSATLHIESHTLISEANHSCIEFNNNYSHSCDIEIIDDATNTKLRYDTDKGYTIPANTFVQITVLGHCWTFKEYTQPS